MCSISRTAHGGNVMAVERYHRTDVNKPLMSSALPLKLKSRLAQALIVLDFGDAWLDVT